MADMALSYLIGRLHGAELAILFQGTVVRRCVARCTHRQTQHRHHHPLGVYLPPRESNPARAYRLTAHLRRRIPYAVNNMPGYAGACIPTCRVRLACET